MFRRGKLAFLSTKDDRIKIINERINLTEKYLIEMCSAFASCSRKMAKYRDAYDELAKGFKNYADDEEINESLSEGLKNITNGVTILSDYMDLNVHRLEMKVVNELAQFENLCKTTRDNLRSAVIARDKEVLKQRQMLEIKSKFSANNSGADSELLKAKLEVNRTNKEIDEIIANFEKRKLNNVKTILTDFILISIRYHTKALEALSAIYYDVSNIDERSDFMEFQKLMKSKEDPKSRKLGMKKGLRSQSMESLDRDQLLSPLKRREKISRSNKNLAERTDDEEEEEEEDEDDDEEDEEDDSDNTNDGDHDSASGTEEDDDDDASETSQAAASMAKPNTTFHVKKPKSKMQIKQPFKAVTTATHVFKHKSQNQSKSFAVKGKGGIPSLAKRNSARQSSKEDKEPVTVVTGSNKSAAAMATGGSRLVTVVESKRKSGSAEHSTEVIDCSRGVSARK